MDTTAAVSPISWEYVGMPVVRCARSVSGPTSRLEVERRDAAVLGGFHDAGAALLARLAV
jgi:hypothetical protein